MVVNGVNGRLNTSVWGSKEREVGLIGETLERVKEFKFCAPSSRIPEGYKWK